MKDFKVIWTTGGPIAPSNINCIGYIISEKPSDSNHVNMYQEGWSEQADSMRKGYRAATPEEIAKHWKVLHPKWEPKIGDQVIITQDHKDWCNKRAVITKKHSQVDYWDVEREDGQTCCFDKTNQMIIAPYAEAKIAVKSEEPVETVKESKHGFTIGDVVIPSSNPFTDLECTVVAFNDNSIGVHCPSYSGLNTHDLGERITELKGWWYSKLALTPVSKYSKNSEDFTLIRFLTEAEFKKNNLWSVDSPKNWASAMNKYMGQTAEIKKSDINDNGGFNYRGWTFCSNDYKVISPGDIPKVTPIPEPKVQPKVQPKKELEKKTPRFKLGDKLTYKSKSKCKKQNYRYGGIDHDGYVGTITEYGKYEEQHNCYQIRVTCKEDITYAMLETEFEEWDNQFYWSSSDIAFNSNTGSTLISGGIHVHHYPSAVLKIRDIIFGSPSDSPKDYYQTPVTINKNKNKKTKLTII